MTLDTNFPPQNEPQIKQFFFDRPENIPMCHTSGGTCVFDHFFFCRIIHVTVKGIKMLIFRTTKSETKTTTSGQKQT